MNQDSSFPPMLPPSTELGALLFAVLPCLQEAYRPLASFAYHMTELTKIKNIPSMPHLTGLSGIDALITDKDIMLRSLSFYGRMFRMPLLSTIATLLQGMQFYQAYKDILPGLFSGMAGSGGDPSSFGNMAGLFSGLGGLSGFGSETNFGNSSPDLFSMLSGLSPDLLSSLFSGFSGAGTSRRDSFPENTSQEKENRRETEIDSKQNTDASDSVAISREKHTASDFPDEPVAPPDNIDDPGIPIVTAPLPEDAASAETPPDTSSDSLYDTLYSFLTPEQQKIYEQLMHTD